MSLYSGGQKIYSGNNANVDLWAPELKEYVSLLQDPEANDGKPYSYRYIGALVGEFGNLTSSKSP